MHFLLYVNLGPGGRQFVWELFSESWIWEGCGHNASEIISISIKCLICGIELFTIIFVSGYMDTVTR